MTNSNSHSVTLSDVAHALGIHACRLRKSFDRFLLVMPEAEDHIELVEETTRGGFGGRCLTYRVDSVALAAFLYWREHRGRLPRIFGVERCVVDPVADAYRRNESEELHHADR